MTASESLVVECGEMLDISRVSEFYAELKMVLEDDKAIELDGSKIERIDTAGLQLLVTFCQQLKAKNRPVQWREPSEALQRSAQLVGLVDELGL